MYKTCRHLSRLAVAEQPHRGEHSLPGTAPFSPGQEAALLPAAAWLDGPEGHGAARLVRSTLRCWNKVTSHVLCRVVRFRTVSTCTGLLQPCLGGTITPQFMLWKVQVLLNIFEEWKVHLGTLTVFFFLPLNVSQFSWSDYPISRGYCRNR